MGTGHSSSDCEQLTGRKHKRHPSNFWIKVDMVWTSSGKGWHGRLRKRSSQDCLDRGALLARCHAERLLSDGPMAAMPLS